MKIEKKILRLNGVTSIQTIETASIAFCLSSRTGLGHLRRATNIAAKVKRQAPAAVLTLITNGSPSALSRSERALFSNVVVCERDDMARHAHAAGPDIVAVDTAIIPRIELLPQPLALIVREMPAQRLAKFRLPNARPWDLVLVAAPQADWSPDPNILTARRTVNVGWIYRTPERDETMFGRSDGERILLLATGGGGGADNAAILAREFGQIVAGLRSQCTPPVRIVQAVGPRTPRDHVVAGVDAVVDVQSGLDRAFASADAVISTAGYNSVLELALTSTPAVLCPIARTYDDQSARVEAWAPRLGLAHANGAPGATAHWLADVLTQGRRRPPVELAPSGCATAAGYLLDEIGAAVDAAAERYFIKTSEPAAAERACQRSGQLFAAGVATAPGMKLDAHGTTAFARIDGPTAKQLWSQIGSVDGIAGRSAIIATVCEAIASLHRAPLTVFRLSPFDPFEKIDPRLDPDASAALANLPEPMREYIQAFAASLKEACNQDRVADCDTYAIHGDFHLGQLIAGMGAATFAIVDFDDMARGEREADVGNCIAHITTSRSLYRGHMLRGFLGLTCAFTSAYEHAGGERLSAHKIKRYGAIALLRRALKLAETGVTDLCADVCSDAGLLFQMGFQPSPKFAARTPRKTVSAATGRGHIETIRD